MWNDKDETPKMKKLKASGDKEAYEAYRKAFARSVAYHKANAKSKPTSTKIVSKKQSKMKSKNETKLVLNAETLKLQKLVSPKKK